MKTGNVLTVKSTLLLRSIIIFSLTLTTIGIALFLSTQLTENTILIIAGLFSGIGVLSFLTLYTIKENIEETNTADMISWAKKNYGININRKQAIELVRYGNAEFGNENHMIQLSLVERNGNFSLHKTQEIKILKEME